MKEIINLSNFSYNQLTATQGFKLKIEKTFKDRFASARPAYFEITYIDAENEIIYVFAMDTRWNTYAFRFHANDFSKKISQRLSVEIMYADMSETMSNENFLDKLYSIENYQESIEQSAGMGECLNDNESGKENYMTSMSLYEKALSEVSIEMQYLTLSNDFLIEEKAPERYDISLKSFLYKDLEKMVAPTVRANVCESCHFKIFERTENTLDMVIITDEMKMYQLKVTVSNKFKAFMDRYVNYLCVSIKPSEVRKVFRDFNTNQIMDFLPETQRGVINAIRNLEYNGRTIQTDASKFSKFLFMNTVLKSKGSLREITSIFEESSDSSEEAKRNMMRKFMSTLTFDKKEANEFLK